MNLDARKRCKEFRGFETHRLSLTREYTDVLQWGLMMGYYDGALKMGSSKGHHTMGYHHQV